jgi:hypothetical protein
MTTLFLPVQLGSYANDGTGDDLRTAFSKVNNSFAALLNSAQISNAVNIGPSPTDTNNVGQFFADKNLLNLEFKTLTSIGSSVSIGNYPSTVNIEAITKVQSDTIPVLGGNLNLNNNSILGSGYTDPVTHITYYGDVKSTVNGYDVGLLASQVALMLQAFTASNNSGLNIDFGSITSPAAASMDFGSISPLLNNNQLDFGTF